MYENVISRLLIHLVLYKGVSFNLVQGRVKLFYLSYFLRYKHKNLFPYKQIWVLVAVSKITIIDFHQFLKEIMISIHLVGNKKILGWPITTRLLIYLQMYFITSFLFTLSSKMFCYIYL